MLTSDKLPLQYTVAHSTTTSLIESAAFAMGTRSRPPHGQHSTPMASASVESAPLILKVFLEKPASVLNLYSHRSSIIQCNEYLYMYRAHVALGSVSNLSEI